MPAPDDAPAIRTEDQVGPYGDKHRLIVDGFPEVHRGPRHDECATCREAIQMAKREET